MGNLFAQAQAQLQAQAPAQLSRESTMCVIVKSTLLNQKLKAIYCFFYAFIVARNGKEFSGVLPKLVMNCDPIIFI